MSQSDLQYQMHQGDAPLIAVALHDGHAIRNELKPLMVIKDEDRLREEDPFTGEWASIADTRIIVGTSRFEIDLNRVREEAVYLHPEDCWGLTVWGEQPSQEMIDRSLAQYDLFYERLHDFLSGIAKRHKKFVVFDFHSYNYMRNGPNGDPADPAGNPEINIGTGTMHDRTQWAPLIDQFIADLSAYDYFGRRLDVRENVKFLGRKLAQFTHDNFPESACVLSVEFKKFFMDEWTGKPDPAQLAETVKALQSTVSGVLEKLNT